VKRIFLIVAVLATAMTIPAVATATGAAAVRVKPTNPF
jgi:hypothetical protein